MSDIRVAYYNKTDERVVNDIYNYYATLENWCSDPAIIEEKIFNADLHSGMNYSVSANIGVPHMAHFFSSLHVRKTSAWSKYNYIVKEINNFDEPIHADVLILHIDILIFLTDDEVNKILSSNVKILIDGAFEAFVFPYYYPILKIFVDKYQPQQELFFVVGTTKINNNNELENAFKKYTGVNLIHYDYFRVNEAIVGSSGLTEHHMDNPLVTNFITEDIIKENFYSKKTKDFLCLNNRPRFHRMALIEKIKELDLLNKNYVSRRWQWPAKKHIVQPLIRELYFSEEHSDRMLDELKIYNETPESLLEKLKAYPHQILIEDLQENVKVNPDKDNAPDILDDRSFSNTLYKNSYYSIAVETYYESSFIDGYPKVLFDFDYTPARTFLTEKVFKPIQFGHMFIPYGMKGTMKALENLGYQNFHEEFDCDYTYDTHNDDTVRYNTFISIIQNFDKTRITEKTLDKILNNYRLFYSKKDIYKSLDNFYTEFLGM